MPDSIKAGLRSVSHGQALTPVETIHDSKKMGQFVNALNSGESHKTHRCALCDTQRIGNAGKTP